MPPPHTLAAPSGAEDQKPCHSYPQEQQIPNLVTCIPRRKRAQTLSFHPQEQETPLESVLKELDVGTTIADQSLAQLDKMTNPKLRDRRTAAFPTHRSPVCFYFILLFTY